MPDWTVIEQDRVAMLLRIASEEVRRGGAEGVAEIDIAREEREDETETRITVRNEVYKP